MKRAHALEHFYPLSIVRRSRPAFIARMMPRHTWFGKDAGIW
jgi:hypothetical protein